MVPQVPWFWWLPEVRYPLWPCLVLILVFIPISLRHERNWRRTLAEYSAARAQAGATDGVWPPKRIKHLVGIQPWLLFAVAGMLGFVIALAIVGLVYWPHTPPLFYDAINYFDRPYLTIACVIGIAAVAAIVAVAVDISRQPWAPVADKVRRSIYASPEKRAELFSAALRADQGVPDA